MHFHSDLKLSQNSTCFWMTQNISTPIPRKQYCISFKVSSDFFPRSNQTSFSGIDELILYR